MGSTRQRDHRTRCRQDPRRANESVTAGVTPITLHGARHSYATLALASGARLDVISRQFGHASMAITADVYGHPDDEAAATAAEALEEILRK
jgi:integrase